MDMETGPVRYEVRDGIAFITLSRPEQRNAINGAMCDLLKAAWVRLEADDAARVGVLCAQGDHFSVGKDIKEREDPSIPHRLHMAYPPNGRGLFKPLISAVQGYCMGGAYAFAVRGCDLTIAADDMVLGFPEAKVGIAIPPIGYTPYMPFKVSLEFLLLAWKGGNFMKADRAYQLGMVNAVVPRDRLMAEATLWAERLKEVPPLYIRSIKYGHYKSAELRYLENERDFVEYIWPQIVSADKQEAIASFREGRKPVFKGR